MYGKVWAQKYSTEISDLRGRPGKQNQASNVTLSDKSLTYYVSRVSDVYRNKREKDTSAQSTHTHTQCNTVDSVVSCAAWRLKSLVFHVAIWRQNHWLFVRLFCMGSVTSESQKMLNCVCALSVCACFAQIPSDGYLKELMVLNLLVQLWCDFVTTFCLHAIVGVFVAHNWNICSLNS